MKLCLYLSSSPPPQFLSLFLLSAVPSVLKQGGLVSYEALFKPPLSTPLQHHVFVSTGRLETLPPAFDNICLYLRARQKLV